VVLAAQLRAKSCRLHWASRPQDDTIQSWTKLPTRLGRAEPPLENGSACPNAIDSQ